MKIDNNEQDNCCFTCAHFYDVDGCGIGKCEKAHGGLSHGDNVCKCYLYVMEDPRSYNEEDYDE